MNTRPTRTFVQFLCLIAISFLLNLSCNKEDEYALLDAVLNKEVSPENKRNTAIEPNQTVEGEDGGLDVEEEIEGIEIAEDFESRTTTFFPVHDAYLQNGKGFNQSIVRLQENRRTSYLMFDLSQIDSIGGYIKTASLEFIINKDDGNGKIAVFKGSSNDWTENNLTEHSAPEMGAPLGSIEQEYRVNTEVRIDLHTAELLPELSSLVLNHKDGDDLAFASKENKGKKGPKLVVEYNAPVTSEEIVTDTRQNNSEDIGEENESLEEVEEEATEEGTNDEITEEETIEEATEDEAIEEATEEGTNDEITEEEMVEEEAREEGTSQEEAPEETVEEENSQDETTEEEDTTDEVTAEEQATEENTTREVEGTTEETVEEEENAEEPIEEEPTSEAPAEENPAVEEPATEEPVSEVPVEEEVAEEPKEEQPKSESPTEEQTTEEPASDAPADEEVKEEPKEEQTTSDEPVSEAPTEEEPVSEAPAEEEPAVEEPAAEEPVSEAPAEEEPLTEEEPAVEEPAAEEPVSEAPAEEEPAEEEPTEEEPAEEEPTEEEPVAEEPVSEVPAEEAPAPPIEQSNTSPIAKADATPSSGYAPLNVSFNGSDSSDDKAVTSYVWNFKDGTEASNANVDHTFTEAGSYEVELLVTDEEGLTSTENVTITVNEKTNEPPTAKLTADKTSGTAPLAVSFTGSKSTDDNSIASYSWDFKDGSSSNKLDTSHTFENPGTYNVELSVVDGDGSEDSTSIEITVNEIPNEAPVAEASADKSSGTAPLNIRFTGSDSTDDNAVTDYFWDFKDGSSSTEADTSHTFDTPGTYIVELSVGDENEQTNKDTITITVNAPQNEAPKAVATPSTVNGDAPLQVDFTGSNSSDDKGVVDYSWDFQDGSSTSANTTHTFDNPGVYNIALTVTDEQGLQDTATLTVTVNQPPTGNTGGGQIPCSVGGGKANETGAKIWCWDNINIPSGASSGTTGFSDGQLALNIECSANQVVREGNRLKFALNPTNPSPASWCNNDFNMRSEIRTMPWNVGHSAGTEEWFGFSYTFGDTYTIDRTGNWLFWQVHEGSIGASPLLSLQIDGRQASGFALGELMLSNTSQPIGNNKNSNYGTGIVPVAGQTLDIVIHVIWGDDSNGLWEVWVDGALVHSLQAKTVRAANPKGGNAKWGIYKHKWRNQSGVDASAAIGVTDMEMFMGPLRIITRRPGDADYGKDSYSEVTPD